MLEFLKTTDEGDVLVITLSRPKANAMGLAMLQELHAALGTAADDDSVRAVLIASDQPKFFSSGFDLGEVLTYDREQMGTFFGTFMELGKTLVGLSKPTVAAVSGHAYAGGALIAMGSDVRIFAEGKYGFALNEINLGIVLTPMFVQFALNTVGPVATKELILEGLTYSPERAVAVGLANELVAADSLYAAALARASALAAKPAQAFAKNKALINERMHAPTNLDVEEDLEAFLDHWFSEESKAAKDAAVAAMKKK